jgi:hypothetical protein
MLFQRFSPNLLAENTLGSFQKYRLVQDRRH